jgi:hypothetical protein
MLAIKSRAAPAGGFAVWLIVTYYAAAHPRWKHGPQAAGQGNPSLADGQLRIAEPLPAAQARADADHDATREKHAKLAA